MKIESFSRRMIRYAVNNSLVRLDLRLNKYLINPNRDYPEVWYRAIGEVPGGNVIDIGSGRRPFPPANTLVEKYLEPSIHSNWKYPIINGKKMVEADIEDLPFEDKKFDFVFCSHVLEHVEDPLKACLELMRVGKRGYIETPRIGTDSLFSWGTDAHKWLVHSMNNMLCFFEINDLLREGIQSTAWRDILSSFWYHPLQKAYYRHSDAFNVMFNWSERFDIFVFREDKVPESFVGGKIN